jgi:hypothetical protein
LPLKKTITTKEGPTKNNLSNFLGADLKKMLDNVKEVDEKSDELIEPTAQITTQINFEKASSQVS